MICNRTKCFNCHLIGNPKTARLKDLMKKGLLLLGLLILSLGVGKGLYFLKDGFSFRRIHSLKRQSCLGLDKEAKKILQETFTYIGRGRQCFAFQSNDGKYVLKFPRTDIYSTPLWAKVLPVKAYRTQLEAAHKEREEFIRESFKISFNSLKEETGLIAVHLGQTEPSKTLLTVVDAAGSKHKLPLYKTSFVLQYKYPILMNEYLKARKEESPDKAKKILDALVDVVIRRAKLGVLNRDRSFLRNFGFDGDKAYQIDVGSFFRNSELKMDASFQKSIRDSLDPVQEWLKENDPDMLSYLDTKLHSIL